MKKLTLLFLVALFVLSSTGLALAVDGFEPDNGPPGTPITTDGAIQSHDFDPAGDRDWMNFSAVAGAQYTLQTSNLAGGADTFMNLYDQDGATLLAWNDDAGSLASQIVWTAPATGTYYIEVRHFNEASGTGSYDVSVASGSAPPPPPPGGDPDLPAWDDPSCQVCHGPVEGPEDVWAPARTSDQPISLTLRNIIKFRNGYALKVMKVERAHDDSSPTLDLGYVSPDSPGSGHFWTRVYSNAPYTETYRWTDFSDGAGQIVPADRMSVSVTDNGLGTGIPNGGVHPVAGAHPPTNPSNWERVDVGVALQWNDPISNIGFANTLDVVVTQQ